LRHSGMRIPKLLDDEADQTRAQESAQHFDSAIAMQPQDFPLHKMACDLSIVQGDAVALLRYVTLLADALGVAAGDGGQAVAHSAVAEAGETGERPAAPATAAADLAAAPAPAAAAAAVPVADSIGRAGRKSVMDYAMAGWQLAKIQKDWRTALACLKIAERIQPKEPAIAEGIGEAKAAISASSSGGDGDGGGGGGGDLAR
jgi:hypothetical protein